jgi:hypothetical protein
MTDGRKESSALICMAVTRQGIVERRGDNPKEVERRGSYLCLL